MNKKNMKRFALAGAALLGGAVCFAGETVLSEATSGEVVIDNLPVKSAAMYSESLPLPAAWGLTNAPTLTIAGVVTPTEGTNYLWNTGVLFPDAYELTLAYGTQTNTVRYAVGALAEFHWRELNLDNTPGPRVASAKETMTMPAAWGETSSPVTVTFNGDFGEKVTNIADVASTSFEWNSVPFMPGNYTVILNWGGTSNYTSSYTIASLADADNAKTTSWLDNQYDEDASQFTDIRDIANHTNVFTVAWDGSGTPTLTFEGNPVETSGDTWTWNTNGLTYALYSFTNTVLGADKSLTNMVARFRVNADQVIAMFNDDKKDVFVTNTWAYLPDDTDKMSRPQISAELKKTGENGLELWKSYMLGIAPNEEPPSLKSNISIANNGDGTTTVTLTPLTTFNPPKDSIAKCAYKASDTVTGTYTNIGFVTATQTNVIETTTQPQRFYKATIDLDREPREVAE